MYLLWALLSLVAIAFGAVAKPANFHQLDTRDDTRSPCAVVSSSLAATTSPAGPTPTIEAQLAYDCLNSVPLHAEEALDLVEAILPYIEWQSDLAYLKDPPPGYLFPAVDIFGSLANIKDKLKGSLYASEYQFHVELYQVFSNTHDGHFIYYSDLLSKVFDWGRQFSLVSVSLEASELPKIYITSDIDEWWTAAERLPFPSEVKRINGLDASQYVEDFSLVAAPFQDPDAAYNSIFFGKATAATFGAGYFSGGGRYRFIYPGPNTTFEFSNETVITSQNIAYVKADFTHVTDGESLYQKICVPSPTSISSASTTPSIVSAPVTATPTASIQNEPRAAEPTVPGYPDPIYISSDMVVSGYFLNGSSYDDVAVLSVLSFEPNSPAEFQDLVQGFLSEAKSRGKTKIIVDLSSNGGGYILQGYDLYRQFFPHTLQDGFTRFRENDAFSTCAEIISNEIPPNYDPSTAPVQLIYDYENPSNYRYDLDIHDRPFPSFDRKFKPHTFKGDKFTSIVRWNLNDPLTTINTTFGLGIEITGYGTRQNFTQLFAAEDIIMLFDGLCSSTCGIFSEFMRVNSGVKSIVMGGRPSTSQMQAVGGVKGAEILTWNDIHRVAQHAFSLATSPEQKKILANITDLPLQRSTKAGINFRDNILRTNLDDGVPAQFVYQAADCRLFWTPPMMEDITEVWKAVADAAFGEDTCWGGKRAKRSPKKPKIWQAPRRKRLQRGIQPERSPLWKRKHGEKAPL